MDDETAEIELLEQNLNKTRQTSQRMISILTSFDTRLAKLEKSILPLYNSTQVLNRRSNNIEKALMKIDEMASNHEGVAVEESLILCGPQPGQLNVYKDALERLNASIAFKTSDRDTRETAHLVETGAKKLAQLYTKTVAEGCSGPLPLPGSEASTELPPDLLSFLLPLVDFLRTLPLPSTHPSHPAAQVISSALKDAQRGYSDMRGTWCRKCLEGQGKRVVDRADTIDGVVAGREFGKWVQNMLDIAEAEYDLLTDLSPLVDPSRLASTYNNLLVPLLTLFSNTLSSIVTLIKRSLHKYTFLALASFESLSALQTQWDKLFARRVDPKSTTRKENNELKEGLHALRSVCLRSFPEFLADLKVAAVGRGSEGTGLADIAISTVEYLGRVPEVKHATASVLTTLGDGNWKMGEGKKVGTLAKLGEGYENVILEHYMYDVINTLINTLNALSKTRARPAFGSIFLLNNFSYLREHTLIAPRDPSLPSLLSQPTQALIDSNFRIAKAAYFDSNFTPLMQALTDDPKDKSGGKAATKERFTRFYDLLEEVMERHRVAKVLEDDEGGREALADDVVKLVVPSLQRFTQKQKDKEFSKNPQKYIKMSPEAVETQIRACYR